MGSPEVLQDRSKGCSESRAEAGRRAAASSRSEIGLLRARGACFRPNPPPERPCRDDIMNDLRPRLRGTLPGGPPERPCRDEIVNDPLGARLRGRSRAARRSTSDSR